MPQGEDLTLMLVGLGFVILGVLGIILGRREDKAYFDSLTSRPDLREFMSHWPPRPQPGALKIGGWIAVALGVVLLLVGIVSWIV